MVEQQDESEMAGSCPLPDYSEDDRVRLLLGVPRTVAIVGMSPNRSRISRQIGMYLKGKGFRVIPVHPQAAEVAGLTAYPSVSAIPASEDIDIVNVVVSAARVGPIPDEAAKMRAKVIWFQPGAENPEAERRARELGLEVFSGRCIMADHMRLIG